MSEAIKNTLGPSAVVDLKTDTRDGGSGQWMGDTTGKMDKPKNSSGGSSGSSWVGASTN